MWNHQRAIDYQKLCKALLWTQTKRFLTEIRQIQLWKSRCLICLGHYLKSSLKTPVNLPSNLRRSYESAHLSIKYQRKRINEKEILRKGKSSTGIFCKYRLRSYLTAWRGWCSSHTEWEIDCAVKNILKSINRRVHVKCN